MKNKIIPLLYSGLLSCTAPKVMNPVVPEVIIDGEGVAITFSSKPSGLPAKQLSLEEMAAYVAAALNEMLKQKGAESISIQGSVSYGQGNYGFDYAYVAGLFCVEQSFQPIGEGTLKYDFRSIAQEPSAAGTTLYKTVTVMISDYLPFGKIDSHDQLYVQVAINDSIKLSKLFPIWKEAQQFHAAMLRGAYEDLQEHQEPRNRKSSRESFELIKIKESTSQELDVSYTKFMQTLYAQEPFDNNGWSKKPHAIDCSFKKNKP